MGPIGCPEMSARKYHFKLRKIRKNEDLIYISMEPEITHIYLQLVQ